MAGRGQDFAALAPAAIFSSAADVVSAVKFMGQKCHARGLETLMPVKFLKKGLETGARIGEN